MKIRNKMNDYTDEQVHSLNRYKALDDLARKAGFDDAALAHTEFSLMSLFDYIVEECAKAAERHARTYSDGDAATGSAGAANAVRAFGKNFGNE